MIDIYELTSMFRGYGKTCSIMDLEDKAVSFIRSKNYISYLKEAKQDIWVIALDTLEPQIRRYQEHYCPTVNVYYTSDPEYEFVLYHNRMCKYNSTRASIGDDCVIHDSAILGTEGLKVINTPDGDKMQFNHGGHVIVGRNVNIGAYTVVHRGLFGVTTIGSGTKVGSSCTIGYNCHIGRNNVIAPGVILNGGVYTGSNCWIGSGTMIKHYVSICDNVALGMGSIVVKDIEKPGIYAGNPTKYLKPLKKNWTFWSDSDLYISK